MLDASNIGYRFKPFSWPLERGLMRLFAEAIGERNPLYTDDAAARAAGYRAMLAAPTLLAIGAEPEPGDYLDALGIDPALVLHAEQEMEYRQSACAGDRLSGQKRVTDVYVKKGGLLTFLKMEVEYRDAAGAIVCVSRQTVVVRGGEKA